MAAGIERDFGAEAAATSPAAAIARIRQTRLRLGDWLGQSEWHWLDQRSISATSRLKINIWKGSMNALLLWVLAFARLPPSNRAAAQQVITPENHQATATAKQERKQGAPDILATITRSRSTNSRGYEVVIRNDGSATAEIGGSSFALRTEPSRSQQFPPGTIDAKALRRLLTEIGDVSKIPTGGCPKSAPSERALRLRMRARPVEICNASDSKHRTAVRRHCKHRKTWADSCRQHWIN